MLKGEHGLYPDTALAKTALLPFADYMQFDWHICTPLIDSSAVSPQDWAMWLQIAQQKLPDYDGMLVLHGTDTLAYSANIFALTLEPCHKPIVFTGSQKPFNAPNSDAPNNLKTAINALNQHIGVVVAFHGKIFSAVGISKISTENDDGFANEHFGVTLPPHAPSNLPRQFNPNICILPLYLTPTHSCALFASMIANTTADALIIQSYGHGNAPDDVAFLTAIGQFVAQKKWVLNISQVAQGCATAVYAQGHALRDAGVINAGKCNIETACALLMLATYNAWTRQDIENELHRLNLL